MSDFLDSLHTKDAFTANGAVTHSTSLSACLDYFFVAGATRNMHPSDIVDVFIKAYYENPTVACAILFWARDIRGGSGERNGFRIIMSYLANSRKHSTLFSKLLSLVPEYGYWKDVFLIATPNNKVVLEFVVNALESDWLAFTKKEIGSSLLAKYFPRKGKWFSNTHYALSVSPKGLRKILVALTNVVESKMCANKWGEVNYESVPSIAMKNYSNAFGRRDVDRYKQYIDDVNAGNANINAGVLYPHDVIKRMETIGDLDVVVAMWNGLKNYMDGCKERILPVCDASASMLCNNGLPMYVSIALGLYISERNEGIFKNAFMTFSETPTLQYVAGNIVERVRQIKSSDWGMSTNLQATFDLILNKAKESKVPADEMPTKLLIISDMEFDEAISGDTNINEIIKKYKESGYSMPEIIFWNVAGRAGNVPAQKNQENVGLVSGFSPSILTSILQGKVKSPFELMLDTVMVDRYKLVTDIFKSL